MVNVNALYDLLTKYGSPLYFYDELVLRSRCQELKNFCDYLENELGITVSAHYSTKSNPNPAILKVVNETGLNVDCMSPFELRVDEISGFTTERMLYVCNNITAEEMKLVHDKGILICLDSISQVDTWGKLFPGTKIMVRINPGVIGVGHSQKVITSGKDTKFGISEGNFAELQYTVKKYDLKVIGTHQHLGSLFLNDKIKNYIAGVEKGLNLATWFFPEAEMIDLGGGFGVPYQNEDPLDFSYLEKLLLPVLKEALQNNPNIKELKFEPGRFIPCEAGILLGWVTAIKNENGKIYVGTNVGMNQLVRPSMYDSYHEIKVVPINHTPSTSDIVVNYCGNICESGDILGKNRKLDFLPEVGDIVVVNNAGAYGYSMASNYTGRPRPAEVMLKKDGSVQLIRKAETVESLLENIVL